MSTTEQSETIQAWLIRYIRRQRFVDSLDWIAEQLRLDAIDGHAYTKEPEFQAVRDAWAEQMKLARQEQ